MSVRVRLIAACIAATPAAAMAQAGAAEAERLVADHRINMRVPCTVPVPAVWNAPAWAQERAAAARADFHRCLADVMAREEARLADLEDEVDALRMADEDWTGVDAALDAKWDELGTLEGKLNTRNMWANTAVEVLDIFTGPGAVYDSSPLRPGYGLPVAPAYPYARDTIILPGVP
jgi:hypothetical protein